MTTTVVCPQCGRGAEIAPGEHPFCRHCDYPLFWVAPRQRPVITVEPDPMPVGPVCVVCRTANDPSRSLCLQCGQPLAAVTPRRRRTWETPAAPEDADESRRRNIVRAVAIVGGVAVLAFLVGALAFFFWPRDEWEITVLDRGEASWDISAALDRGIPVIAYVDASDYTLRVVVCGNELCDTSRSATTYTTVTSVGEGGQGYRSGIAVGVDGRPIIAFRDGARRALMVAQCGDTRCADGGAITITEIDPGEGVDVSSIDSGSHPSIVIGADGRPIIAYQDRARGALKIAHCVDSACTSASIAILDRGQSSEGSGVGADTAITIGPDGLPIVAFRDGDEFALKIARCSDERCTQAVVSTVVHEAGRDPGHSTGMRIAPDGSLVFAYADWSDDGIYVARCPDTTCGVVSLRRVDRAEQGVSGDVGLGLDHEGFPVVAFRQREPGDERASRVLRVVRCADVACARDHGIDLVDDRGRTGYSPRVLRLDDGTIAVVYGDATEGTLEYAVYR